MNGIVAVGIYIFCAIFLCGGAAYIEDHYARQDDQ